MHKYNILKEINIEEIEKYINYVLHNCNNADMEDLKKVDSIMENILYTQKGRKDILEQLSYTKYKLGEYLLSFQYGIESFKLNKNSISIIYSILSLLKLNLYNQAHFIFIDNKQRIINIINSNKSNLEDVIDILIYFKIDITLIDDIKSRIENLQDKRKKYIYILLNLIKDRKKKIIKNNMNKQEILDEYKNQMNDIYNILEELNLYGLSQICKFKLENKENLKVYEMLPCDNIENHIAKSLIDEMNIEENNNNYIPNKIKKYNFEDDNIKIISYKSKSLASMHVVKIKDDYIILDCGAKIKNLKLEKIDVNKFLTDNEIPKDKIKAVIISHAHLDHYGSLDLLQEYTEKIYMTKDTHKSIKMLAKNLGINYDKIKIKNDNDEFYVDKYKVEFFPTNHICGSIGVCIYFDNSKMVYTGDFSFNRQSTTKYINEKDFYKFKNAEYLIIETTCGYKNVDLPYIYSRKLFTYFINLSIKNKIKVIIPAFSVEKAYEYYNLVANSTINGNILIEGSGIKKENYCNKKEDLITRYNNNDVIIVQSSSYNEISLEKKYYDLALRDDKMVTILNSSIIDKNILQKKLKPQDSVNINLVDVSLSSHANYEDLIKTVNVIEPKNLIMVHGKGIKLYDELNK